MSEKFIKREIFPEIIDHLKEKEITVIIGPRQTGKTTLLFQSRDYLIEKEGISPEQIKVFNLDLISDLESVRNQSDFIKFLQEKLTSKKKIFVFIDEAQRIENVGLFLKGIYDLGLPIKFVITGSSSFELKEKVSESLTGRKKIFHLYPFSFSEFLSFQDSLLKKLLSEKEISSYHQKEILDYFYEFAVYGGYPRVVLEKNKEKKIQILKEIYSSYIERDIVGFLKIKNPLLFSKLVKLLASQVGQLINLVEISNTLRINYRTLENYFNILEKTFILYELKPFFKNTRKELTKMPKLYFIDNGLRNFAISDFSRFSEHRDKGILLENFIFSSLIKDWLDSLYFWRTKDKSEVDFILKDYFGNIIPLEVKSGEISIPKIPRGLQSFINSYNPKQGFIVNLSTKEEVKFKNTKISFIFPYQLKTSFKKIYFIDKWS